jgi:hypothetical protein
MKREAAISVTIRSAEEGDATLEQGDLPDAWNSYARALEFYNRYGFQ